MYHYVYRITHIPTSRFYVGIRTCRCHPGVDKYMGSGVIIKKLLDKHPPYEFRKDILQICDTREAASTLESKLVDVDLLQNPLCLNLKLGGDNSVIPNQFKSSLARTGKKKPNCKNPWIDPGFRARITSSQRGSDSPYPFMVSNGYWWVWKDSFRIFDEWVVQGGEVSPTGMPKRGSGHKSIGMWYASVLDKEYHNLVGDESVFRNMVSMFKDGWNPYKDERFLRMVSQSVTPGIVVVRGTSGTGKGTRVVQFIEWLRGSFNPEPIVYEYNNKPLQCGFWFKEINLVFIGKYTKSNKSNLTSWTSMDFIHSTLKTSELANSLVKYIGLKYKNATIILEGEPMMQSHRWRPSFVHSDLGYNNMAFISFVYETREQYDERIIGRSGKAAKETGWSRNEQYKKDVDKVHCEFSSAGYVLEADTSNEMFIKPAANGNGIKNVGYNKLLPYDSAVSSLGEFIIEFVGLDLDVSNFKEFCKTSPMLRSIGGTDPLAHRVEPKPQRPETIRRTPEHKQQLSKSSNVLAALMGKKK